MPVFNKIYRLLIILSPLLILSCWNSSPTSDNDKAYKVSGSVIDKTGSGIEGVSVQITGTNFSITDTTGTGGAFSFNTVKSGDYKVEAMKDSCFFKPASFDVSVSKTDIDTLKIHFRRKLCPRKSSGYYKRQRLRRCSGQTLEEN